MSGGALQDPGLLAEAARGMPAAAAQQRLSGTPDRDLAIALLRAEEADRGFLLSFVNAEKRRRVLQEIERLRRVRLEPAAVRLVLAKVIRGLTGPSAAASRGSWFRPRKKA